jgi:hypothetical protein
MKFVILSPSGIRTGGPEACFQLSDTLIQNGFDAEIWLVTSDDVAFLQNALREKTRLRDLVLVVPERSNLIAEYSGYRFKPFSRCSPSDEVAFVLPEVYLGFMPFFAGMQVLVWWLSVDNAFSALSSINLNSLRTPDVRHAVQSVYAERFVSALGFESTPLTDYTVARDVVDLPLSERPLKLALNAGPKVISDLNALTRSIAERIPDVDIVPIVGLSQSQVSDALSTSRLFIDLGKFPGKDRMPREAIMLGTNIIIAWAGAGMHMGDFPIAEMYRAPTHDLQFVARLAAHMIVNPEAHAPRFKLARDAIAAEKDIFSQEVLTTFSRYFAS